MESEEFKKLYGVLSKLSSKVPSNTGQTELEPIINMDNIFSTKPKELAPAAPSPKQVDTKSDEFKRLYERLAKMSSKTLKKKQPFKDQEEVAPVEEPLVEVTQEVSQEALKEASQEALKEEEPVFLGPFTTIPSPNTQYECEACHAVFSVKRKFLAHKDRHHECRTWLALPSESKYESVTTAIHAFLDECLKKALTGKQPLQCKFCGLTFVSRSNHHKHYHSSLPCNRMAYLEFKKLICELL